MAGTGAGAAAGAGPFIGWVVACCWRGCGAGFVVGVLEEGEGVAALDFAEVGGFGGEEFGGEIARGVFVGVAALAGLAELELCVGG